MKRVEKERHLANVSGLFREFGSLVVANFESVNAADFSTLRRTLKLAGCGLSVVKNSIAHIALEGSGKEELKDKFSGAVFVAYSNDIITLAKVLSEFIKKIAAGKVNLVCAYDSGQVLPADRVTFLANLPSLEELRMRIMCLIAYGVPMRLAGCIKAMGDNKSQA
ncbi:50S ribosomal protein L10 [Anaplasma bovis]|uniref:50S ribosomal protein L10 n=1 Tax=Anaplasma bovis TaxID=186733 RepID=UPI002FF3953F